MRVFFIVDLPVRGVYNIRSVISETPVKRPQLCTPSHPVHSFHNLTKNPLDAQRVFFCLKFYRGTLWFFFRPNSPTKAEHAKQSVPPIQLDKVKTMSKKPFSEQLRDIQQLAQVRQILGHASPDTSAAPSPTGCIKECEKALEKLLQNLNKQLEDSE